jgi:hypothetical protein
MGGTPPIPWDDHYSFPPIENSLTTSADALGSLFWDVIISPVGSSHLPTHPQDLPKSLAGNSDWSAPRSILLRTTPTPRLPPSVEPIPLLAPIIIPASTPNNEPPNTNNNQPPSNNETEPVSLTKTIIHAETEQTQALSSNETQPNSSQDGRIVPTSANDAPLAVCQQAVAAGTDETHQFNPQAPRTVPTGAEEAQQVGSEPMDQTGTNETAQSNPQALWRVPTGAKEAQQAGGELLDQTSTDHIQPNACPNDPIFINNTGGETVAPKVLDEDTEMESG